MLAGETADAFFRARSFIGPATRRQPIEEATVLCSAFLERGQAFNRALYTPRKSPDSSAERADAAAAPSFAIAGNFKPASSAQPVSSCPT